MATKGIGGYAANRPERPEEFSSEFKRDLLDIDPESLIKSKKKKKRRDDSSSSSDSDSSDSDSSSDHRRKKKKKSKDSKRRRRRRRTSENGHGRDRRRSSTGTYERSRARLVSGETDKSKDQEQDDASSYKSPSDLDQDSDLESNGLDVKYKLDPLIYSLKEDREKFNKQIFKIIRGRRRRHLMPKVLRNIPDKELKQTCLTELARWSNKRCRILMRTGKLLESEDEEAITKVPDIDQLLQTGETVVTAAAEKIKEAEKAQNPEKADNSSDEEDIEQMRANLAAWREKKTKEEMDKLKLKQEKELDEHRKEIERDQQLLERELEEKRLAKQKIAELSEKLNAVSKELKEQEGLVLWRNTL